MNRDEGVLPSIYNNLIISEEIGRTKAITVRVVKELFIDTA